MSKVSKANKVRPFNRKILAQFMSAGSNDYLVYEFEDMIDRFTSAVEKLVKEGYSVSLDGFGTFQPKINPAFTTASLKSGTLEMVDYPGSVTMKFTPAVSLQKRIKEYTKSTKEKQNEAS